MHTPCFRILDTMQVAGEGTIPLGFFSILLFDIEDLLANKILILGKVGFQSDQITAASWSGNTCQPSNQLIITLIRLLFAC